VANRSHAIEVALRVDVQWLASRDCMDFFGRLMRRKKFAALKHLFLTHESGCDLWLQEFDSDQFAKNLQDNSSLESLSLEIAKAWGNCIRAVGNSSRPSTLQFLSVKVNDEDTLLQIFRILSVVVHLRNLRVEMRGAAVKRAWENRQKPSGSRRFNKMTHCKVSSWSPTTLLWNYMLAL